MSHHVPTRVYKKCACAKSNRQNMAKRGFHRDRDLVDLMSDRCATSWGYAHRLHHDVKTETSRWVPAYELIDTKPP
jgi:hypothetical protein